MSKLQRIYWTCVVAALGLLVGGLLLGSTRFWQPAAVASCVGVAIGLGGIPLLRGYQFTAWIIAAVVSAMIFPAHILHIGPIDLRNRWIVLTIVQLVMFGMGTQMTLKDFAGIARMPWGVLVGIVCQFTIMPLVGFGLTRLFELPDEVAAGIVLIGSCSSGLASNVMVYLAQGNLALSITLTAVATLMAPLMTPLWMKLLADELVHVDFFKMMQDIIKMVIVPIGAALLHAPQLPRAMPRLSMFGIVYFTAVTTAAGRDDLLAVGGLLLLAAIMHNTVGYVLGYWLSRCLRLDRTSARTVAFEVGLQNGGMASGLAGAMGKLGTVGLASAIFSPWMNVSGSLLANYWRRRPSSTP